MIWLLSAAFGGSHHFTIYMSEYFVPVTLRTYESKNIVIMLDSNLQKNGGLIFHVGMESYSVQYYPPSTFSFETCCKEAGAAR